MNLIKKLFSACSLALLLTVFFLPHLALAQTSTAKEIPLQVEIPGISSPCSFDKTRMCVTDIGDYISKFYIYFAGAAGILATCMILFAGFTWITAAGNSTRIEKAKSMMNGAFIGLVLTLTSYLILKTINPDLVKLRMPPINVIQKEVLATNFCKDLPIVSGVTPVANADTIPCGQKTPLDQATAGKSGYTQDYCCGSFCKITDPKNPQICAVMQGSGPGDCPEACVDAESICTQTDKADCDTVNDFMQRQGVTSYACRKADLTAREDKCKFSPIIFCPQAQPAGAPPLWTGIDWSRISCAYFGSGSLHDTPCWAIHNPTEKSNRKCTDYKYPAKETDGVCCAAPKKEAGVYCKDACENKWRAGNNEGEVEISCVDPVLGNEFGYNSMGSPYAKPDDSNQDRAQGGASRNLCVLGDKCCLRIMFYIDRTPATEKE